MAKPLYHVDNEVADPGRRGAQVVAVEERTWLSLGREHLAPDDVSRAQHRIPGTNQHPVSMITTKQSTAHGVCRVVWI